MLRLHLLIFTTLMFHVATEVMSAETTVESKMIHLRIDGEREWDSFAEKPDASDLNRVFESTQNHEPWTLSLRQNDLKQRWEVRINDKLLGRLIQHEEDLTAVFEVPAGVIQDGENRLQVRQTGKQSPDDILVGEVTLHEMPIAQFHDATISVDLVEQSGAPLPGRITVVNSKGVLTPVMVDQKHLAARSGVVYTSTGKASFKVPHGSYRIIAGRGFEYGIAHADIVVGKGETATRKLILQREVDTADWVACDTHVHTVTHSGHGDCSIEERMITLAGEGIELPIATDHNKQIDYRPVSSKMDTARYFTPVVGNEVTTKHGHFNVFPATVDAAVPDHKLTDWTKLFNSIFKTPNVKVAILNHARDIHSNFRPFSPRHHVSLSGENLDDWELEANAMEILNSGATQTDPKELFHDWCGLVNHGRNIVPIGCSDSHDVSRYIVGQARTYLRCDDQDPNAIDVGSAIDSLLAGRLIVSYGLMADVVVMDKLGNAAGPGEMLTPCSISDLKVKATIRGPHWCTASAVELYVNGQRRQQNLLTKNQKRPRTGVVCEIEFTIPRSSLKNDAWITVVALGNGVRSPHWRTAKPYQPDSPHFEPHTFSCCGPIRIDVRGDQEFSSANEIAKQIVKESAENDHKLISKLAKHDSAVAIQVASLLGQSGTNLWGERFAKFVLELPKEHRLAINEYRKARRASENARLEGVE